MPVSVKPTRCAPPRPRPGAAGGSCAGREATCQAKWIKTTGRVAPTLPDTGSDAPPCRIERIRGLRARRRHAVRVQQLRSRAHWGDRQGQLKSRQSLILRFDPRAAGRRRPSTLPGPEPVRWSAPDRRSITVPGAGAGRVRRAGRVVGAGAGLRAATGRRPGRGRGGSAATAGSPEVRACPPA